MDRATLAKIAASPAEFRAHLIFPGGRGPARFGEAMADFQRELCTALDPAFLALAAGIKPPIGRYFWEGTKGCGKDFLLGVQLAWLLAFSPRAVTCQVGAADQSQADEVRKSVKALLRLNPWLAAAIEVQAWSIINKRTGSTCEILAADVAGSHGARPDLLILNELHAIEKKEFCENLLDNSAKMPFGVAIIATNAGFRDSWQFQWRENARTSPRWRFISYTQPAPWLDPAEVAEAERRNSPARFARLFRGIWQAGSGETLEYAAIQDAIRLPGPTRFPEPELIYFGGWDLAYRKDHASAVVTGLNTRTGKLKLALVRSWAPSGPDRRINLADVEEAIIEIHRRFAPAGWWFDMWQSALMAEHLTRIGAVCEPIPFSGQPLHELAQALLENFQARTIEIFPHPELITDLQGLRFTEVSAGYKLFAERTKEGGHCDRAVALGLSLVGASRAAKALRPPLVLNRLPIDHMTSSAEQREADGCMQDARQAIERGDVGTAVTRLLRITLIPGIDDFVRAEARRLLAQIAPEQPVPTDADLPLPGAYHPAADSEYKTRDGVVVRFDDDGGDLWFR